jgi:hypothetical protein
MIYIYGALVGYLAAGGQIFFILWGARSLFGSAR